MSTKGKKERNKLHNKWNGLSADSEHKHTYDVNKHCSTLFAYNSIYDNFSSDRYLFISNRIMFKDYSLCFLVWPRVTQYDFVLQQICCARLKLHVFHSGKLFLLLFFSSSSTQTRMIQVICKRKSLGTAVFEKPSVAMLCRRAASNKNVYLC